MGRVEQVTGRAEISPNLLRLAKQRQIEISLGWQMSEPRAELFSSAVKYLGRFSDIFTDELEATMRADESLAQKDPRGVILQHLKQQELLRPHIGLMDYAVAKQFLAQHKIFDPHAKDSRDWSGMTPEVFVNFELPKALSQWWAKGVGEWGNRGKDLGDMVIEWGKYYREIMPLVWKKMRVGVWSQRDRLFIERLNAQETHVVGEYYNVYVLRKIQGEASQPVWPPVSPFLTAYERAKKVKKLLQKK